MKINISYIDSFTQKTDNYKSLKLSERLTISQNYFFSDKRYISKARLNKAQKNLFKKLFIELHIGFYSKVVSGPDYVKTSRIILNFLFLRTKENMRLVLFSTKPYNLTGFVHGIRSQIEINALLNRFLKENDKYFEEYFIRSEDRKGENPLLNVLTLIDKMGDDVIHYRNLYDDLSNILHPNPTAVKMHVQAKPSNNESLFNPWISLYFDKTFPNTSISIAWFDIHLNFFSILLIHFLDLIAKMDKDFFINKNEESDFNMITLNQIINQKEFKEYIRKKKDNTYDLEQYSNWLKNKKK